MIRVIVAETKRKPLSGLNHVVWRHFCCRCHGEGEIERILAAAAVWELETSPRKWASLDQVDWGASCHLIVVVWM